MDQVQAHQTLGHLRDIIRHRGTDDAQSRFSAALVGVRPQRESPIGWRVLDCVAGDR